MTNWTVETCAELPSELELISSDKYIERRNIHKVKHEKMDDMPEYEDYQCESREIGISEYEMLKSIQDINNEKAIEEYTAQLMEQGVL